VSLVHILKTNTILQSIKSYAVGTNNQSVTILTKFIKQKWKHFYILRKIKLYCLPIAMFSLCLFSISHFFSLVLHVIFPTTILNSRDEALQNGSDFSTSRFFCEFSLVILVCACTRCSTFTCFSFLRQFLSIPLIFFVSQPLIKYLKMYYEMNYNNNIIFIYL
jgi:hypothetical protein